MLQNGIRKQDTNFQKSFFPRVNFLLLKVQVVLSQIV